ncbi:hypothetical protein O4160_24460 [Rhodococcus sp. IEGM 1401]|uniref:hypothetical protein n=1 Tax=unclassified Rhodococcus (in: high G+C Gram-positive bacteria) TaxID=192944 RepID=UPI0022B32D88|nr:MULTISPECIES: hypothetical protein [unclassified Rhodococcus (in: high G+C Gram-positive bacteria)]MCZ4563999.1 hypothetical protein [Rhodococcus sp. IEGM 1401]MDI9924153.1 hypothetical protein [Rhodococcus sp. IEGM 1372]MDV8036815.1 hypothetical protein [Rhodococcus sp. IEGM 1414]
MNMADDINAKDFEQQHRNARALKMRQAAVQALEQQLTNLAPNFAESARALKVQQNHGIFRKAWNVELTIYDGVMINGEYPNRDRARVRIFDDGTWIHLNEKWKAGSSTYSSTHPPTEIQVQDALKQWLRIERNR